MQVRLLVGNLAFDLREATIRSIFERFGIVERVELLTDPETARSRGLAFVTMANEGDGHRAVAWMDGAPIGDRLVRVEQVELPEIAPRRAR